MAGVIKGKTKGKGNGASFHSSGDRDMAFIFVRRDTNRNRVVIIRHYDIWDEFPEPNTNEDIKGLINLTELQLDFRRLGLSTEARVYFILSDIYGHKTQSSILYNDVINSHRFPVIDTNQIMTGYSLAPMMDLEHEQTQVIN